MKQHFLKTLIGASLACTSLALQAQVYFGNQVNTGNQYATLRLNNVIVTESELNVSAIGNVMSASATRGELEIVSQSNVAAATQTNSGNQFTTIDIAGANTNLTQTVINGSAVGNAQTFSVENTASFADGTQRGLPQVNSGEQSATLNWALDPTTKFQLNLSSIGNAQSFSIK